MLQEYHQSRVISGNQTWLAGKSPICSEFSQDPPFLEDFQPLRLITGGNL